MFVRRSHVLSPAPAGTGGDSPARAANSKCIVLQSENEIDTLPQGAGVDDAPKAPAKPPPLYDAIGTVIARIPGTNGATPTSQNGLCSSSYVNQASAT